MRNDKILILTAIFGACITSAHTFFISKSFYGGMIFTAFTISMTSSFHMKRIADGTITTRLMYSIGATIGSVIGLYISKRIIGV